MGIHFTCKTKEQPIFRNDLIPGRAISGINGKDGISGTNGASIHFSDYSPNNDYIKGMMREKIKKNLVLSSGNTISLKEIKYVNGDIILSKDLLVYRLDINNNSIDFTYLGKLIDKQKNADIISDENLINNIGDIEFINFDKRTFDISIPSNRCIDSSASMRLKGKDYIIAAPLLSDYPDSSTMITYNHTFKRTFGFNFKPIIHVTDSGIQKDWNFYLRIYTKIKKSPQYNSYILSDSDYDSLLDPSHKNMQGAFEFYKYAEIKLNAKLDGSNTYQEDINYSSSIYNITDMSCDKLHPAGNNINSNFVHSHNYLLRKFFGINWKFRIGGIDNLHLSWIGLYNKAGSIRTREEMDTDKEREFSEWSMYQFQRLSYNDQRGYLQYSLYKDGTANFRSGDSAYFSGMYTNQYNPLSFGTPQIYMLLKNTDTVIKNDLPYDSFIRHEMILNINTPLLHDSDSSHGFGYSTRVEIEKDYVCGQIDNFLFNPENIYELVCVNKNTGVTKILNPTKIIKTSQSDGL